ncbi:SRPBCC family protein [Planococcus sp. 4-30]|uniref:SRPBCC family protein n=1 Tax=Planococcus sp. 4-30 TaxID=2874583 RepID=UPI001CBFE3A3|nr:SRPBCC family protein [Planococcus sp. 4-30]
MWNIKKGIYIDRPIDEVYQYAIDPTHWFQWYVGLSEPENLVGKGETGTTMDMKYTMLGMHMPIKVEVLETSKNGDSYSWKGTVKGAVTSQQFWTYVPEGEGTEITLDMDYELPGKLIGKVANTLIIKKLMDNSVEQTLSNLKAICETSDTYSMQGD